MAFRGFQFKLHPAPEQAERMSKFCGVVRLIYNLGLEQRRVFWRQYRAIHGNNISYVSQAADLTKLRAEFDWIEDVHVTPSQQALKDLNKAFEDFKSSKRGFPKPRKKGVDDSFRYAGRELTVEKLNAKWARVRLPKIGWMKFRQTREMSGTLVNATVRLIAGEWFISFAREIELQVQSTKGLPSVGIDRGVARSLYLSSGDTFDLPDSLKLLERKQRKAQKEMSRRKRGSKRRDKSRRRVAAIGARMARIRGHWQHEVSRSLARRFNIVVLEDLKIKNMTASAKGTIEEPGKNVAQKAGLNRSILNQGWYLFEEKLAYKLEEHGGHLCTVPAHYTSQTCSGCGTVAKESRKNQASFCCITCGSTANADHNAAINILRRNTASMTVEGQLYAPVEAVTSKRPKPLGNPRPSGRGRC